MFERLNQLFWLSPHMFLSAIIFSCPFFNRFSWLEKKQQRNLHMPARQVLMRGITVFAFDFAGCGQSEGHRHAHGGGPWELPFKLN